MQSFANYTVAVDWEAPLPRPLKNEQYSNICFFIGRCPSDLGWEYRELPSFPEIDRFRLSRMPKAMPHRFLPDFDGSIYSDATVQVLDYGARAWQTTADSASISLLRLPQRANLRAEFDLVRKKRFDSAYVLEETLNAYSRAKQFSLDDPVYWGGLIARKHLDPQVVEFGERWWWNILRHSRRDQLSLPGCLKMIEPSKLNVVEGNEEGSKWHSRLKGTPKHKSYQVGFVPSIRAREINTEEEKLLVEIASLRSLIEVLLKFSFLTGIFRTITRTVDAMRAARSKFRLPLG